MPTAFKESEAQHSEVIQDIISAPPAWILKWGIIVILSIIACIIGLSALIKYPDIITTPLKITSTTGSTYYGDVAISSNNLTKVKTGQNVNLKFIRYPYEEYGVVKGEILSITEVSDNDSIFLAKVSFKNTLHSSSSELILLKNGMNANAEIITADVSVLSRIFKRSIK